MATNFDPIASETQVNLVTANDQVIPDVGAATDGRFLVAYQDVDLAAGASDIHLQFVNPDGSLSGSDIAVEIDSGAQFDPAVAPRLGGGAVVVWVDDADGLTTHLQLVNANGSLSGNELQVSDKPNSFSPDAALLANGQVVVTFARFLSSTDHDIFLRVLNADGTTFATQGDVEVDNSGGTLHDNPSIAASGNNALIVFEDNTGDASDIIARLYDGVSGTVGPRINIASTGDLNQPDVAALSDGRYIVVWDDEIPDDIQARFIDANGNPQGTVFTISIAPGNNEHASVAALPDGGFVVTWTNNAGLFPTEQGANNGVVAQRFDSTGAPAGDLFLVNAGDPLTSQEDAAIAVNPLTGRAFIAWEDFAAHADGDNDGGGIRGHAFQANTDVINGTAKADVIKTFGLGEHINGLAGNDTVSSLGGNDVVHGNSGNDGVNAGFGNDSIFGDTGNDTLNGGAGNDLLVGGQGKDVLAGGSGRDRFDFNTLLDSVKGANRDVISLFSRSDHDRIDLSTIDANRAVAGNQAFHVIGAQPFHDIAGEVRFAGGILQGDVNGDGISDFEIKVTGVNTLVAADLVL